MYSNLFYIYRSLSKLEYLKLEKVEIGGLNGRILGVKFLVYTMNFLLLLVFFSLLHMIRMIRLLSMIIMNLLIK